MNLTYALTQTQPGGTTISWIAGIKAAFLVLAAAVLVACQSAPEPEGGVIYLVRHAEKVTDGGAMVVDDPKDPPLTAAGAARAETLSELLMDAGITQVWSTDYTRTRDTAAPLAKALGLEVSLYDPRDLTGFAEILKAQSGEMAVVVGHSNTTPTLVEALGGDGGTLIDEAAEYDRLYVVDLRAGTSEIRRYGALYRSGPGAD